MSIVNMIFVREDYITRADLVIGDFFEYKESIWICTEDTNTYNPTK